MIEVIIFTDIETLPTDDPDLIAAITNGVVPPKSMKKAETISAWEANEKPALVLEAIAKTSLDGGLGRCAAIAFAIGDGDILSEVAIEDDGRPTEDAERWMIEGLFAACEALYAEYGTPPILAGHNVAGFDLRWLWKRAIVLGITVPWWWPHDARSWDQDRLVDTMILWEGPRGYVKLDRLAARLGIRAKSDMDGSQVASVWAAGEYQRVREYCADDVRVVREVYHRLVGNTTAKPRKAKRKEVEAPPVDADQPEQESMLCF